MFQVQLKVVDVVKMNVHELLLFYSEYGRV